MLFRNSFLSSTFPQTLNASGYLPCDSPIKIGLTTSYNTSYLGEGPSLIRNPDGSYLPKDPATQSKRHAQSTGQCRCFCVMLAIIHAVDAGLDFNDLENEDTTIFKMFPSAKHDDKRDQSGAQRGLQNPRTKKSDQSTKFSKINKDL